MVANFSLDLEHASTAHSMAATMTEATIMTPGGHHSEPSADSPAAAAQLDSPQPTAAPANLGESVDFGDEEDDERLKRLLANKRLSEGCLGRLSAAHFVQRKNSLHMIEELPVLTEGEPVRHHTGSYLKQQLGLEANSNSNSTDSAGQQAAIVQKRPGELGCLSSGKRGSSQEDSATSSSSLDRSPTSSGSASRRRRSSTVSQCSSVLSEGTRQQLNFDLSPDLAPDSSLLEANAISPSSCDERPASPEPAEELLLAASDSPTSKRSQFGCGQDSSTTLMMMMRAESRMSTTSNSTSAGCDKQPVADGGRFSPDSTLGDSNDQEMMAVVGPAELARLTLCYGGAGAALAQPDVEMEPGNDQQVATAAREAPNNDGDGDELRAVEQLISNVSGVLVSETDTSETERIEGGVSLAPPKPAV